MTGENGKGAVVALLYYKASAISSIFPFFKVCIEDHYNGVFTISITLLMSHTILSLLTRQSLPSDLSDLAIFSSSCPS